MNAFYSKLIIFIGINQLHCQDDDYFSGYNSRKGKSFPCMKHNVQCRCEQKDMIFETRMFVKCDGIGLTNIPELINKVHPIHSMDLHNNKITELTPRMLNGLGQVRQLNIDSNEIAIIEDNTFSSMSNLEILDLNNNKITKLTPRMLNGLKQVGQINISSNEIAIIEDNTFSGMYILEYLDLHNNKITKLTPRMLSGLNRIQNFMINSNEIAIIEDNTFSSMSNLEFLNLYNNKITKLTPRMLNGLKQVRQINISSNEIAIIEDNTFSSMRNLEFLNLSSNKISELPMGIFHGLKKLEILILENNAIRKIENDMFKDFENLKELNLARNSIIWTNGEMLNNTSKLTSLTTDEYRLCCLMIKRNLSQCIPKVDEDHCNKLLKETVLRICVRIIGVVAIFANLFVIVYRTKYNKFYANKINSLLIRNLAISDLFMGFYLLIIVMADIVFAYNFNEKDFEWRCSTWCHLAGIMSTFSSSLTAFTLIIITIERMLATISPFRTKLQEIYQVKISLAIAWIVAVIIAIIPLPFFQIEYFDQFYSRSGTCLPLHMSSNKPHAWQYSVFIFLVLYSIAFTIVLLSYVVIYRATKKTRQAVNVSNDKSLQQIVMIFRMTLFVLADATCKIPVIILGVQSLSEHIIEPTMYQWMAIFVTPLNAALNPILYTLSSLPFAFRFMEYLQSKKFRSPIIVKYRSPVYRKFRNQTTEIEDGSSDKTTDNKRRKKQSS